MRHFAIGPDFNTMLSQLRAIRQQSVTPEQLQPAMQHFSLAVREFETLENVWRQYFKDRDVMEALRPPSSNVQIIDLLQSRGISSEDCETFSEALISLDVLALIYVAYFTRNYQAALQPSQYQPPKIAQPQRSTSTTPGSGDGVYTAYFDGRFGELRDQYDRLDKFLHTLQAQLGMAMNSTHHRVGDIEQGLMNIYTYVWDLQRTLTIDGQGANHGFPDAMATTRASAMGVQSQASTETTDAQRQIREMSRVLERVKRDASRLLAQLDITEISINEGVTIVDNKWNVASDQHTTDAKMHNVVSLVDSPGFMRSTGDLARAPIVVRYKKS